MIEHKCDRKWVTYFHDDDKLEEGVSAYGPAVSSIIRVDDKWYAYNDEYATEIKYCPFCGVELALLNWSEGPLIDIRDQRAVCYGVLMKENKDEMDIQ